MVIGLIVKHTSSQAASVIANLSYGDMIYVNSLVAICTAGAQRLDSEGSTFSFRRVRAASSSWRSTDCRSSDLNRSRSASRMKRIRYIVIGMTIFARTAQES